MKQLIIGAAVALAGPVMAIAVDGLLFAAPVLADVKTGVDAWQQGDYAKALGEWRPLAEAGDADAQFNLGQAYKLGRGVPSDIDVALNWFRKAALQGHLRAEDNYGLLLFQQNRREEAMPYIQKSASRGEPRAEYILGTALFNGEYVGKDWVRAYAMMTRASAAGLSQAAASLEQMDKFIPADQRQKGLALAAQTDSADKSVALASSSASGRAIRTTDIPASDISRPAPVAPKPVKATPVVTAAKAPPPPAQIKPAPVVKTAAVTPAPAKGGEWRVQMGAFSEDGRAKALWTALSGKVSGLSAYQPFLVKAGAMTRLQAGPITSSADAEKLCARIKAAGTDCIPKKP